MKQVHINDTFPGESKGKTKWLDDNTANELIALGQAEEVKENADAEGRDDKTDKAATSRKTK